jgi:glycosyltransferase involved in cell wall biosynthesis
VGEAWLAGVSDADRSGFARDDQLAGRALARLDLEHDRVVAFVGKLIVSKGVDLLLAAWPLVLDAVPEGRLLVIGFGSYRAGLSSLLDALSAGQLDRARDIALAGRALEGLGSPPEPGRPLGYLLAFLDRLAGDERERYLHAARALPDRVLFTGRLDHEELAEVLPACEALVVPSTFPESFGMVAVAGAACGALPISAAHSGLAEVSAVLAHAVGEQVAGWLSFALDDHAVQAIAERVIAWLGADPRVRSQTRAALVGTVRERWSWEGVARGVIAAALGDLDRLQKP